MNFTEEQVKNGLRAFFDNPETAEKFAAAMREGLADKKPFDPLRELNEQVADLMELQGFVHHTFTTSNGEAASGWRKSIFGGRDNKSPFVIVCFSELSAEFLEVEQQYERSIEVYAFTKEGYELPEDIGIYTWREFNDYFKGGF